MGIGTGTAILGSGALSGITSLVGGGKQSAAAEQAAQEQYAAAQLAAQTQLQMFNYGANQLSPFVNYGTGAISQVQGLTGTGPGASPTAPLTAPLTSLPNTTYTPFDPTVAQLAQTPGYQFQQAVGSQQIANQQAAQGLRMGGAFATAEEQYATGLAQSTWQQQLQAYMQQYQTGLQGVQTQQQAKAQTYNMLTGQVNTGASGATSLLGAAVNTGGQVAQSQLAGGAALASGTVGSANALTAGLTGASSGISNTALLYAMNQGGMFSNTGAARTVYPQNQMNLKPQIP